MLAGDLNLASQINSCAMSPSPSLFLFQNIDIDAEVNKFSIDLSSVEFFDSNTENQLNDFKAAVNINYQDYINEVC